MVVGEEAHRDKQLRRREKLEQRKKVIRVKGSLFEASASFQRELIGRKFTLEAIAYNS
jgi:hypothetical protein